MGNPFYSVGPDRPEHVRRLFETIAARYDLLNNVQTLGLHWRWKRLVVALAQPRPGSLALDICCGTGDLALLLARAGTGVVGLDFSPSMLRLAKQRLVAHGISFTQGDALRLPFGDGQFDVLTIGYGLRNVADVDAALAEWTRVLKPGGRMVILEFGKPPFAAWRWAYFTYLKVAVPLLGRLFCGNSQAYAYILESLTHYPSQEEVAGKLKNLGYRPTTVTNLVGGAMSIVTGAKGGLNPNRKPQP